MCLSRQKASCWVITFSDSASFLCRNQAASEENPCKNRPDVAVLTERQFRPSTRRNRPPPAIQIPGTGLPGPDARQKLQVVPGWLADIWYPWPTYCTTDSGNSTAWLVLHRSFHGDSQVMSWSKAEPVVHPTSCSPFGIISRLSGSGDLCDGPASHWAQLLRNGLAKQPLSKPTDHSGIQIDCL